MRTGLALGALALLAPNLAHAAPPTAPDRHEDARRLAAILDYVAGDYGEAVAGGAVVDREEYEEQLEFLGEARALAARLAAADFPLTERIAGLEGKVRALAAADAFATDVRALRREVVTRYAVEVAPAKPPSHERGTALYAQHCASCHGATGAADTQLARTLEPPPRNLRDAEVMSAMTPSRAFNAITHGVKETAMPPFPTLSAEERWDLAFTVLALRFDEGEAARGAPKLAAEPPTLAELADRTDAELLSELHAVAADRRATVAWLRRSAPFAH